MLINFAFYVMLTFICRDKHAGQLIISFNQWQEYYYISVNRQKDKYEMQVIICLKK